jgi:hypothetical protein
MNQDKVRKLIRLLSSPQDHEVVAAARALTRSLAADGQDIHALAESIGAGELSEADMRVLYDRGFEAGKRAAESDKPMQFGDVTPWKDMAAECLSADNINNWLQPHERAFVEDMVHWCERREPSEKQGKWLHVLWTRAKRRRR